MRFLYLLFLFVAGCGHQKEKDPFVRSLQRSGLDKRYELQATLHPPVLTADFNGDGHADQASWVVEKPSGKKGILLLHGKTDEAFIFGAGIPFGEDNDDNYHWADQWSLYTGKTAYETQFDEQTSDIIGGKDVTLQHPGIIVMAGEDGSAIAGGIIYWDGKKYAWIHQGE